jgi:thiol:disulfide interchange protein DsbD
MERMKQLLAFPLYGTVAWLAWVLGAQVDNDAVMRLLATLVVIAFALWAWRAYRGGGSSAWSAVAAAGLAAAIVVGWPLVNGARDADAAAARTTGASADNTWQPYTTARVAELATSGVPCSSISPPPGVSLAR